MSTGAGSTRGKGQGWLLKGMDRVGKTPHSLLADGSVGKSWHRWTGMEVISGPDMMLRLRGERYWPRGGMQVSSTDIACMICLGFSES